MFRRSVIQRCQQLTQLARAQSAASGAVSGDAVACIGCHGSSTGAYRPHSTTATQSAVISQQQQGGREGWGSQGLLGAAAAWLPLSVALSEVAYADQAAPPLQGQQGAAGGPSGASGGGAGAQEPLTNHPLDYDPVANEHTAKMTMARSAALEYYQAGKYAQAEAKFKEALAEAQLGFDAKDPHIASAKNNLAEFYRNTGRWKDAEQLYGEALAHLLEAYGTEKHWLYVSAMHNMALMYEAAGQLDKAASTLEHVLALRLSMFGPKHFLYADTMFALGHVVRKRGGKRADARAHKLMSDAIDILDSAETVQTTVLLFWLQEHAEVLAQQGRHGDAAQALRKALYHMGNDKGDTQAQASQLSDQLVAQLSAAGKHKEAAEVLRDTLAARAQVFGRQLVVAQTALRLAQVEQEQLKQPQQALQHTGEAVAIAGEVLASTQQQASGLSAMLKGGAAGADKLPRRLKAAHVLASALRHQSTLLLPQGPAAKAPAENVAAADAALSRAMDVLSSASGAAESLLNGVAAGRPLPAGIDAEEVAGLLVEVQLLLLEVLEALTALVAAAPAATQAQPGSTGQGQDKAARLQRLQQLGDDLARRLLQ